MKKRYIILTLMVILIVVIVNVPYTTSEWYNDTENYIVNEPYDYRNQVPVETEMIAVPPHNDLDTPPNFKYMGAYGQEIKIENERVSFTQFVYKYKNQKEMYIDVFETDNPYQLFEKYKSYTNYPRHNKKYIQISINNQPATLIIYEKMKPETMSADTTIYIKDFSFYSNSMNIPIGTTVTWVNYDTVEHTVTSNIFDYTLNPGKEFRYTFDKAGVFEYRCSIHPSMTGKLYVTAPFYQIVILLSKYMVTAGNSDDSYDVTTLASSIKFIESVVKSKEVTETRYKEVEKIRDIIKIREVKKSLIERILTIEMIR